MQYRRFGSTDVTVSELGVGCARIGGLFQDTSRADQLRLLRQAFEAGITFYDTADMYAQGESERLLGQAFAKDRHKVVIASKVGYRFSSRGGLTGRAKGLLKPLVTRLGLRRQQIPRSMLTTVSAQDFSPAYITQRLEDSLRRLGSDYLDVYQLHSPPPDVLERGEFVETLERLKQQGKLRYWGIACERPEDVLLSMRYAQVAAVQVSLSLLHPEALEAAIPRAAERGTGIIARQVLASGLLGGSPDRARGDPRQAQIAEYAQMAEQHGQTLPALAVAFVLAQPNVSVALLGMHRPSHLQAALGYLDAPRSLGRLAQPDARSA